MPDLAFSLLKGPLEAHLLLAQPLQDHFLLFLLLFMVVYLEIYSSDTF